MKPKTILLLFLCGFLFWSLFIGISTISYSYNCSICSAYKEKEKSFILGIPIKSRETDWIKRENSFYERVIQEDHQHIYFGGGYSRASYSLLNGFIACGSHSKHNGNIHEHRIAEVIIIATENLYKDEQFPYTKQKGFYKKLKTALLDALKNEDFETLSFADKILEKNSKIEEICEKIFQKYPK